MAEFTADKMIVLLTVVFPLMLLAAALVLGSGVCVVLPLLAWIGIAFMLLYIPTGSQE
jgi:hypothetical protein